MIAAENQAILILAEMVKQNALVASSDHGDMARRLEETEARLARKIDEHGTRVDKVIEYCAVRKREVDAMIAAGIVSTDARIAASSVLAVAEATKPSPYRIVTKGLANFAVKLAAFAATCTGVALAIHALWS